MLHKIEAAASLLRLECSTLGPPPLSLQLRLFEQFEYGIVFFSRGKVFHEKKTWCRCIRCGACQRRRKEAPEGLPALRAEFSAEGHLLWARAMEKWFAEDPTRRRGGVAPSPLWDTIDTLTSGLSRVFTAALWVGALLLLLMALWALVPDGDEPSLLKLARREPLVYVLLGIALVPALVRPGALAAKLLELEARQLVPEASPACPAALAAAITAAAIGLRAALTALAASFTGLQAVYKAAATGLWTVRAAAAAAITGLRAALSAATAVAGLQLQAALAPLAAAARGLRAAVAAAMAVLRATVAALAAAVTGVAAALAAAIAAVAAALAAALAALVLAPASLARRMQQRQRQRQQRQQERCSAEGPGAAPPAPQPQPAGSAGGPGSSDGAGSAAVSEQAAPVGFVPAARHEELKQRLAEVQEHLGRLREAHADALRSELEEHATCSVSHVRTARGPAWRLIMPSQPAA